MNLPTGSGNNWRPCCRPNVPARGGRIGTTAPFSTAFSGSSAPAPRGAMCPSGTAPGPHCTAASAAGAWPGCGTACSRRSKPGPTRRAGWTGPCILSMGRSSGRTSMRPGQRGGPGAGGARPQPGRVLDEGPPPGGGPRQAADPGAHPWPAARSHGVRAVAGAGRGPAARPRPAARAPAPSGRRQGLHWAAAARLLPAPGHPLHHPAPATGAPARPIRPHDVPPAQSGGAVD